MTQDVHPELRDENGAPLPDQPKGAADFGSLMAKLAGSFDAETYPLLASIDPYGNTVFNDLQKARLADELDRFAHRSSPDIGRRVRDLAGFIREQAERHRIRIWFVGD